MTNTPNRIREGRHLILVDIENLLGGPSAASCAVEVVSTALRVAVPEFDAAQCVVACSHQAAPTVAFAFPRARHLWRSGPNGADLALLDVLNNEHVEQRFEFVTICSGDGIFAARTASLAAAGVAVNVVSMKGHLAARLRLAAREVVLLEASVTLTAIGSGQ